MMNLEELVQAYADRFGRPVIVFDADLNVTAFSIHDEDVDNARLAIILSHRGSSRAKDSIREYRVAHADGPVRIPPIDGGRSRIVAPVRYEGHVVGYISSAIPDDVPDDAIIEDDTIRASRTQIGVTLAAMALSSRQDDDRTRRLVTALLDGDGDRSIRAADELLTDRIISPAPHYTVITLSPSPHSNVNAATLRLALDRALAAIPAFPTLKAVGAVLDSEAVLVVPYEIDGERLSSLLTLPAFTELRAGVGGAHSPLADAQISRREARIAARGAELSPSHGRMVLWDQLGLDRILLQLPVERLAPTDLPAPVQRLLEAQSGPDLAETLEAYLDHGCDAQQTALDLHIHRSTLYYRLDRIKAIADVDLADGLMRRELHTALRVATLAGLR